MSYLGSIQQAIGDFEDAAFNGYSPSVTARKKSMKYAKDRCQDLNIRTILGASIDYLAERPEHVRAAIVRAKDALETLRTCRPDLE